MSIRLVTQYVFEVTCRNFCIQNEILASNFLTLTLTLTTMIHICSFMVVKTVVAWLLYCSTWDVVTHHQHCSMENPAVKHKVWLTNVILVRSYAIGILQSLPTCVWTSSNSHTVMWWLPYVILWSSSSWSSYLSSFITLTFEVIELQWWKPSPTGAPSC